MGYSDLNKEDVNKYISAIKSAELYTDLILIEQDMIRKGKVNNEAFHLLQEEKELRKEEKRQGK